MARLPPVAWSKRDKAVLRREWMALWDAGIPRKAIGSRVAKKLLRTPSSVLAMAVYEGLPQRPKGGR